MYKTFDLLKDMNYVRTGGSVSEKTCAEMLLDICLKNDIKAEIEEFDIDSTNILCAQLTFLDPNMSVECAGVGMSGSTGEDGITGEFIYVDSLEAAKVLDIENKICLLHSKLLREPIYKVLIEKKVKGIILCTGDVYKDNEIVDLDPYYYRERNYKYGKIPAVCIRMKDAENILKTAPKKAYIKLIQEEGKVKSRNVVATIEGNKYKDEIIAFTAHYDSVSYSKGAYDNATGSLAILELMHYFKNHKNERTLKFIWCGSEEMGLLGSKDYTSKHQDELANYKLCINIDMIGVTLGYDIACVTSNMSLVHYIKYLGLINGFAIKPYQGVYSSDSSSFADKGVPGLSFARIAPAGGAVIHSRNDVTDYLCEETYYKTISFIELFSEKLINSVCFPVEKEIPENMKKELDIYFGRKERE